MVAYTDSDYNERVMAYYSNDMIYGAVLLGVPYLYIS